MGGRNRVNKDLPKYLVKLQKGFDPIVSYASCPKRSLNIVANSNRPPTLISKIQRRRKQLNLGWANNNTLSISISASVLFYIPAKFGWAIAHSAHPLPTPLCQTACMHAKRQLCYILGTIPILRQHIFGLFWTHSPTTLCLHK